MYIKCLTALIILAVTGNAEGASQYTFTDLGTLGGAQSYAYGINGSGQVVGQSTVASGNEHAFLYADGKMTDIGSATPDDSSVSVAFGINSSGQVLGVHSDQETGYEFLYSNGTVTNLGQNGGVAINASGEMVGNNDGLPVIYENGAVVVLNGLGGIGQALALNDSGAVVGYSYTGLSESDSAHAFLYVNGVTSDLGTLDNGAHPGSQSRADAISNTGVVVGWSTSADGTSFDAFLFRNSVMTDLGVLDEDGWSEALGVNSEGVVVGESDNRAFVYQNGTMMDLNDLIDPGTGIILEAATGINDAGQIIGYGTGLEMGDTPHAFLLSPVSNSGDFTLSVAPEPSSLGISLFGLLSIIFLKRTGYAKSIDSPASIIPAKLRL